MKLTRTQALTWLALTVVGVACCIFKPSIDRSYDKPTVDTLATVERILDGGDLKQRWPGAGKTMLRMSRVFEINPYLLPVISRCENPDPKYHNPCGLTANSKIIQYESYTYGVYRAAELLAKLRPIYDSDSGPNIPSLASVWCPESKMQWQTNVGKIYQQAIRKEQP
jgi:hypothetical protein